MILADTFPRRQSSLIIHPPFTPAISIPSVQQHQLEQQKQHQLQHSYPPQQSSSLPVDDLNHHSWSSPSSSVESTIHPFHTPATNSHIFSFGDVDQPLFDFEPDQLGFSLSQSLPLMSSGHSNSSWFANGQLTPQSATRSHHHRESSLSTLGSASPSSPFTPNTSHPVIVGDVYDGLPDYPPQQHSSKPLTPAQTPVTQDSLLSSFNFYHSNLAAAYAMGHGREGLPNHASEAVAMHAPKFTESSGRRTVAASNNESSLPPMVEERRKSAYLSAMPKLDRTMTDAYVDELYNPNFQIASADHTMLSPASSTVSPQNDVFSQRLQAANSQHLSTNSQASISSQNRGGHSPFRQGSPLAPSVTVFESHSRYGIMSHMADEQKVEDIARGGQQGHGGESKTISPKEVELSYHESEEDEAMPLFPVKEEPHPAAYVRPTVKTERQDMGKNYHNMVAPRQSTTMTFGGSSQDSQQQASFNFVHSDISSSMRQIPQQYPFVSQQQQLRNENSAMTDGFQVSLAAMESPSSEYAPESTEIQIQKPNNVLADTGTYTCTYSGCTLRFETPAKLQKHKREGHRNLALVGLDQEGTSSSPHKMATQAGPHVCSRINPSTGKPCNTIFSRPYDLTRHEDTIHNSKKKKVRCHICTEEKTFSRNDALTRHFRVCHPEIELQGKHRRRNHVASG